MNRIVVAIQLTVDVSTDDDLLAAIKQKIDNGDFYPSHSSTDILDITPLEDEFNHG